MPNTNITTGTVAPVSVDIRARRKALRISQAALSIVVPCSLSHLSNLEAGAIPVNSDVLARVVDALDRLEAQVADAKNEIDPEVAASGSMVPAGEVGGRVCSG